VKHLGVHGHPLPNAHGSCQTKVLSLFFSVCHLFQVLSDITSTFARMAAITGPNGRPGPGAVPGSGLEGTPDVSAIISGLAFPGGGLSTPGGAAGPGDSPLERELR
jgi:hypothetical protein